MVGVLPPKEKYKLGIKRVPIKDFFNYYTIYLDIAHDPEISVDSSRTSVVGRFSKSIRAGF